ncbi:DNA-directed RNA polymerases II 24 kDa polypeptide (RNA polymerase II subunit 5) [Coniosporium tulheliwenetii]|uniref:DNA-directed RNA polymerases II 24 kDa polypeptide (RNA polymerase II subunit 5) n=1 Tax=Coniosporium tulheliwenetii TaxID=3383036 RepID=A0ACC2ZMV8_9PEZI|nr:DNA-directed RNA polymerases II 24 kDa polypeptide (RNA polymerase II subunit 5) [Cladosporium sp. JES 115]
MSEEAGRESLKLWRVWRTTRQMCRDRGYEIMDNEIDVSLDEFKHHYCDAPPLHCHLDTPANKTFPQSQTHGLHPPPQRGHDGEIHRPSHTRTPRTRPPAIGTVFVEFNGDETVGIKQLRTFAHYIDEQKHYTGIFIVANKVSPSALKIIPTVLPAILEVFREDELLVNITMHELVPKHVLLSKEEKAKLLERYRLKESQLPRIQTTDPVAKYLGLRRGQVVKIIRKSETAGRYASYRWAI